MRYTFNLKKAYDDYYLYSHNTVYGTGERPRSEYVSPYKENRYIPEHNITKRMCYNKLGQYEDIDENPEHLAKIKRVFNIIREKKIDTEKLRLVANAYAYNNFGKVAVIPITQEEYDLLNEVLYGLPTKQV